RDDSTLGQALRDDLRLLLSRPFAPPLRARDDLDPPQTRPRRHLPGVVITVNTMVKMMPAHGPASCPRRTPRGTCGLAIAYGTPMPASPSKPLPPASPAAASCNP